MDIQRLRDIARDLMEIPDMADDFRYFVGSFAVMLSDDPLTLDAAVVVMGREPDGDGGDSTWWNRDGLHVSLMRDKYGMQLLVEGWVSNNPTIGQFACLVAAARMGESK